MARTREDRIAARLAKMAGARLSLEEYEAGDDLGIGDDDLPGADAERKPITDSSGKINTEQLLSDLLRALGIHLPNTGGADFKTSLYQAAMQKLRDLTGTAGGRSGANNQRP